MGRANLDAGHHRGKWYTRYNLPALHCSRSRLCFPSFNCPVARRDRGDPQLRRAWAHSGQCANDNHSRRCFGNFTNFIFFVLTFATGLFLYDSYLHTSRPPISIMRAKNHRCRWFGAIVFTALPENPSALQKYICVIPKWWAK